MNKLVVTLRRGTEVATLGEEIPGVTDPRCLTPRELAAVAGAFGQSTGAGMISAERLNQSRKGYDPRHDDAHGDGSLVKAAVVYLAIGKAMVTSGQALPACFNPREWPWNAESFNPHPTNIVRNLVVAGALIAAEIDRLLRAGKGEIEAPAPVAEGGRVFEVPIPIQDRVTVGIFPGMKIVGCHYDGSTLFIRIESEKSDAEPRPEGENRKIGERVLRVAYGFPLEDTGDLRFIGQFGTDAEGHKWAVYEEKQQ